MFSNVISGAVIGIEGRLIYVEVDVSQGLPSFEMVGYLSSEVREAKERVRTAIRNAGYRIPPMRMLVNLAPANLRKAGTAHDLPIAIGILSSLEYIPPKSLDHTLIIGELSLDGRVGSVRGLLSMVSQAKAEGVLRCIVPFANQREAALVFGEAAIGVSTLKETVDYLTGKKVPARDEHPEPETEIVFKTTSMDQIYGQDYLKTTIMVAAAGMHHLLMIGPPGSGKSMIAKAMPSILPDLTFEEQLEVTKIYSVAGLLPEHSGLIRQRPFRSPHHTISDKAMVGGGGMPKPGELTLAHRGVLFLDELPEFSRVAMEVLRQPMEDRKVILSRVNGTCEFPAEFFLICAMNSCRCGAYPDTGKCTCTPLQIKNYMGRVSQALMDRMDLCVSVQPLVYKDIKAQSRGISEREMIERIQQARKRQARRYEGEGILSNSELSGEQVRAYCGLGPSDEALLAKAFEQMNLSARGYYKILKVARTIADLDDQEQIQRGHLCQALNYRMLDFKTYGGLTP